MPTFCIEYPRFRHIDPATGLPAEGWKVYTFEAGTSSEVTTYSDRGLSTPNSNPVILDSNGECLIYTSVAIKIAVYSDADVLKFTQDYLGVDQAGATPAWGEISGVLSDQTDLQTALDAKAAATHVADTANPHSVTKTQVGLANVTNDAQLKRADNDWASYDEEVTPGATDWILLEKVTTGAKKKAQVTNFTSGGGEANTASNQGTAGVGVFIQKTSVDLEFKNINAGSSKITVTDDTGDNEIDIDVDPAEISHTAIADIGTNTHAEIDSHIADTANPHSVTNTQVGLGNVTDDAQLKRSSGDINTFDEKVAPVVADILLIEDSEDTYAKKKVQIANLGYTVAPATNTDDAIALWDGADSKTLKDSLVTIDGSGSINIPSGQSYKIDGNVYYPEYVFYGPAGIDDDTYLGKAFYAQAGENLTQWDYVYLKSDGKMWKAKADSATTCPALAVVVAAVSADEYGWFLYDGWFRDDGGVTCTPGNPIFLSEATAGAIADAAPSTSGNQVQILGWSFEAQIRMVNPNLVTLEIA